MHLEESIPGDRVKPRTVFRLRGAFRRIDTGDGSGVPEVAESYIAVINYTCHFLSSYKNGGALSAPPSVSEHRQD
jgi:hypothetical protein